MPRTFGSEDEFRGGDKHDSHHVNKYSHTHDSLRDEFVGANSHQSHHVQVLPRFRGYEEKIREAKSSEKMH